MGKLIGDSVKWNLAELFVDDAAWDIEFKDVMQGFEKISAYKGIWYKDSNNMYEFILAMHEIEQQIEKLAEYAFLSHAQNTALPQYIEMTAKIEWMSGKYQETIAFFLAEYKDIPLSVINELISDNRFSQYKRFFLLMERMREHLLSEKEELIIAKSSEALRGTRNAYELFTNADLKFTPVNVNGEDQPLTESNYSLYIRSTDRDVRKQAFKSLFSRYSEFKNTLSQLYSGSVKSNKFMSEVRGFDSTLESELYSEEIPADFYERLMERINNILPSSHKYVETKKRILGYDAIHPYDLYVPLVKENEKKYSYEEIIDIVSNALLPLGDEYNKVLSEAFQSRWLDVYPAEGKRNGAFSSGIWGEHPYVLLNCVESFHDILTTTHEMGHAMHSYFTNKTQPYIYSNYSIIPAEIASITNELITLRYLLEKSEDKIEKSSLLNHYLEAFRTTVFRQSLFAEFEMIAHSKSAEGTALTSEYLYDVWKGLYIKYYGTSLVDNDLLHVEWGRIPHFYNSFYVYKYVLGFIAANEISMRISGGDNKYRDQYLHFLSSGSSKSTLELLGELGIDFTDDVVYKNAAKTFNDYLYNFEKSLL